MELVSRFDNDPTPWDCAEKHFGPMKSVYDKMIELEKTELSAFPQRFTNACLGPKAMKDFKDGMGNKWLGTITNVHCKLETPLQHLAKIIDKIQKIKKADEGEETTDGSTAKGANSKRAGN